MPTALLFGLWPAIRLSRVQVGSVLARTGRQRGSALSRRGGQLLIAAEVALAVILVSGAGLMIRSFMRIAAVDLGFARNGLVVMDVLPLFKRFLIDGGTSVTTSPLRANQVDGAIA